MFYKQTDPKPRPVGDIDVQVVGTYITHILTAETMTFETIVCIIFLCVCVSVISNNSFYELVRCSVGLSAGCMLIKLSDLCTECIHIIRPVCIWRFEHENINDDLAVLFTYQYRSKDLFLNRFD